MRGFPSPILAALVLAGCTSDRLLTLRGPERREPTCAPARPTAPSALPDVPRADPAGAWVPDGYRVEVVLRDLVYPTSLEFDDVGNFYVAEAGAAPGDPVGAARIWRVGPDGYIDVACDAGLVPPVSDLLWHDGRLFVSHRGRISVLGPGGALTDVVTDLPSGGDHGNTQLVAGPDGKLYVGQGTATNSGVVGLDNVAWLALRPWVHDLSPRPLALTGAAWTTPDPRALLAGVDPDEPLRATTRAFQPFGRGASAVAREVAANGTILRLDPDGTQLEVFAWGLRHPTGLAFDLEGRLHAADDGFDERGSRPVANAPDCLWRVRQDGWYGWPDFAAGEPVSDPRFRPARGDPPERLLDRHPPCETPLLRRSPGADVAKLELARSPRFGRRGALFLAEAAGVVVVDLAARRAEPFLAARPEALGPPGWERVVTAGPRRPVDVRQSPDGEALYVVDFGAVAPLPTGPRPLPGTGAVWRIARVEAPELAPPPDLSPVPGRTAE